MKRYLSLAVCVLLILGVIFQSGCMVFGDVSNVSVSKVSSDIYSDKDINDAIDVVKNHFATYYQGCTLKEIRFEGDDLEEYRSRKKETNADEVIVLVSDFVTGSGKEIEEGPLDANVEYSNFNWVLVRNKGKRWNVYTYGYG